jgi:hypothetical protein
MIKKIIRLLSLVGLLGCAFGFLYSPVDRFVFHNFTASSFSFWWMEVTMLVCIPICFFLFTDGLKENS